MVLSFLAPPRLERPAPICVGDVFNFWGCARRIVRVVGEDATAPVIVEELEPVGAALPGQLALWSADGVRAARAYGRWV